MDERERELARQIEILRESHEALGESFQESWSRYRKGKIIGLLFSIVPAVLFLALFGFLFVEGGVPGWFSVAGNLAIGTGLATLALSQVHFSEARFLATQRTEATEAQVKAIEALESGGE